MLNRFGFDETVGYADITNDDAGSVDIVAAPSESTYYNRVTRLFISIYEAAEGGGGIFELHDGLGTTLHKMDADTEKDVVVNLGDTGRRISVGQPLQGVVYGAQTKQASVSVMTTSYVSRR